MHGREDAVSGRSEQRAQSGIRQRRTVRIAPVETTAPFRGKVVIYDVATLETRI